MIVRAERRFKKGARVRHTIHGEGLVLGHRHRGLEVKVSFGRYGYRVWVRADELEPWGEGLKLVGGAGEDKTVMGTDALKHAVSPRAGGCRKSRPSRDMSVLEALRTGLVPPSDIEQWTVGREAEFRALRKFLHESSEGVILLEGTYGAGKTHFLEYLRHAAVQERFAVAFSGVNFQEATVAFPKKLWRNLAKGFSAQVDGERLDLRGFLRAVARRENWERVLGRHFALGPLLRLLSEGRDTSEMWEWLEGGGRHQSIVHFPTLWDHTTCANVYCNLITALSRAAVELLDLEGLMVLIDEAEMSRTVRYGYHLRRGMNFFKGLMFAANDEPALIEEGIEKREGNYRGMRTDLVYSGHLKVRFTSGIPSFLKVAIALTPDSLQREMRGFRSTIDVVHLDILSYDELSHLLEKMCDTYRACYGLTLSRRERDRVFRHLTQHWKISTTRQFIKGAMEFLDYYRFYPDMDLFQYTA